MASAIKTLASKQLIRPPKFLEDNVHYEVIMGSFAYGVSGDTSDMDVYGFCIPPKDYVFPHLTGEIEGFGQKGPRFDNWQQHHIIDPDSGKEYDFAVYSIVRFFQLCMENNPNMCDALFVPQRCIIHCTQVGQHVRDNRRLFLHKGSMHRFRGYAFSQLHKIKTKNPEGKRKALIEKYGYDTKFSYNVVRLGLEAEQILSEGELDIERNSEILKSIRNGEWTVEQIEEWFNNKERHLEDLYVKSTLPHKPNEEKIKQILLECLEMHYGSLTNVISQPNKLENMIYDLQNLIEKYK